MIPQSQSVKRQHVEKLNRIQKRQITKICCWRRAAAVARHIVGEADNAGRDK
jgi:hypothetical protein